MIITAGSANKSVYFYIVQDASNTSPGEPVTGLLFSDIETGGSASFMRQGAERVDLTLITLASASATHADGGFILVDDTNMPGVYRCDFPDAAFVTGVDQVICQLVVESSNNAVVAPLMIDITDVDLRDSVRGGMTALPNAAAGSAGGLPDDTDSNGAVRIVDGTGARELDTSSGLVTLAGVTHTGAVIPTVTTVTGGATSSAQTTAQNDLDIITGAAGALIDDGTGAGQIALTAGAIDNVTLVATTTTNTDVTALNDIAAEDVWAVDATNQQTQGTFGQAIGDPVADATTIYQSVATDATGDNIAVDIVAVKAETVVIESQTDDIGVAGAGLTAINLPNQTMDITGNITGNLSGSVGSVSGNVDGNVTGSVSVLLGDVGITATAVDDIWDELMPGHTTADTAGLVMNEWADGGRLDLILDTLALEATVAALNDISTSDVLTQVNAALDTAISELGIAAPAVTPSLRTGLMLLYMALRNKLDVQTSGTDALEIHNDADTQITSKLITDSGGDYSEAKMT